jgi:hypothetical protein
MSEHLAVVELETLFRFYFFNFSHFAFKGQWLAARRIALFGSGWLGRQRPRPKPRPKLPLPKQSRGQERGPRLLILASQSHRHRLDHRRRHRLDHRHRHLQDQQWAMAG